MQQALVLPVVIWRLVWKREIVEFSDTSMTPIKDLDGCIDDQIPGEYGGFNRGTQLGEL